MNILIFTNTFTPHVGGVARSVEAFSAAYRERGHRVLVVAPEFPDMPQNEVDVVRVAAIQNFNASDFSVALPLHADLSETLDAFRPDIVHAQHPFLLGMTALRVARYRSLPLVFTHHTRYEQYTHYVPGDSPMLKRFTVELVSRYANLCDQVFVPSESIETLLREREVTTPITVVPTGVHLQKFAQGDGRAVRRSLGIAENDFVVGHLGRLAPEKNLEFLGRSVADFVSKHPHAHFLVIGTGPSADTMREIFADAGVEARLHLAGTLQNQPLSDALHAMDAFAFASLSETQGMVLTEAMAAGLPVVALDAPGVREVVTDQHNGRLLLEADEAAFAEVLRWLAALAPEAMRDLKQHALDTAETFSMPRMADRALACYAAIKPHPRAGEEARDWEDVLSWIRAEWDILKSVASAGDAALSADLFPERDEDASRTAS